MLANQLRKFFSFLPKSRLFYAKEQAWQGMQDNAKRMSIQIF